MGAGPQTQIDPLWQRGADWIVNWARKNSLWPMFFGLSCCFVEEAAVFTSRYDLARFGAEVLRPSPRQADLLIIAGTVFKKIAPVVLRLYEQMAEPKWVVSMGSCSNSGGMYDVYSVVQGVDQILPVDVYIPGCPPRPEAILHGLTLLQEKIARAEKPIRPILHLAGGNQGTQGEVRVDGYTKARDPRGPGMTGTVIRGNSVTPPLFTDNRTELMWTPAATRIEFTGAQRDLSAALQARFGATVQALEPGCDMPTYQVDAAHIVEVLRYLKDEAPQRFRRLDDLTAVDESARRERQHYPDFHVVYHLLSFEPAARLRLKVPLHGTEPAIASAVGVWPSANWYEREVFDLMGIRFEGHPDPRRLIMPPDWQGHPLRKDYAGRATAIQPSTPRCAPSIGSTVCSSATTPICSRVSSKRSWRRTKRSM